MKGLAICRRASVMLNIFSVSCLEACVSSTVHAKDMPWCLLFMHPGAIGSAVSTFQGLQSSILCYICCISSVCV